MGLGDMDLDNQKSGASVDSNPAASGSDRRASKLVALTFLLLAGALLLSAVPGLAKDKTPKSRTVTGVVFDDAGNTINGAAIELTDLQTKKVVEIYSQEQGDYKLTDIRFDHDYTVKATFKGSSSEVRRISMFETRWTLVLNLTILKPPK